MSDWATVSSARKKPSAPPVAKTSSSAPTISWANAAGRKAGSGTVQSVGRTPVQSKEPKAGVQRRFDAAAAEQAALRAIAKEALEHAMESRDPAVITAVIEEHRAAAASTDALWRANAMVKELTQAARASRKQASAAAAGGGPAAAADQPPSEAAAVAALEAAMASGDLAVIKGQPCGDPHPRSRPRSAAHAPPLSPWQVRSARTERRRRRRMPW